MNTDMINGLIEFGFAVANLLNVRRLFIDKAVKGVSYIPLIVTSCWGFWNMYFYFTQDLNYSFMGGMTITCVNLTYLVQILYYSKQKPLEDVSICPTCNQNMSAEVYKEYMEEKLHKHTTPIKQTASF